MFEANKPKAMRYLSQAIQSKSQGQIDSANQHFLQAFSLGPENPKILNSFGEFLGSQPSLACKSVHEVIKK